MVRHVVYRLVWWALLLVLLAATFAVFAAAMSVPETGLEQTTQTITANDLKPAACAALNLTTIVDTGTGTSGNDLILGSAGNDTLNGGDGDDCILGGAGDDILNGGTGNDILLGGDGDDTLYGDGDPGDECYGEGGSDTLDASCEIQTP